jgi:hypothetical protein
VAHERADRGQAQVAGARRVATGLLEMVKEREYQRRVQILELQR